jgi:hypothetical protein
MMMMMTNSDVTTPGGRVVENKHVSRLFLYSMQILQRLGGGVMA